jgi:hypothetical protein
VWSKFYNIYQSVLRWIRKYLLFPLIWRCHFSEKQLQKKFKHAFAFGITGNCNPSNIIAFKQTLLDHIIDTKTVMIKGSYRGQPVKHFFNPITKLNVMCQNHKFLSAWHLSMKQEMHLLLNGDIT